MQFVDTANNQQEYMYGGFGFSNMFYLSVKKLYITSTDSIQSLSYTANFNNVTLRKSLMFGNDDVHISFNVLLKNTGQSEIRDFYCKISIVYALNSSLLKDLNMSLV
jgi:hypothetical protein